MTRHFDHVGAAAYFDRMASAHRSLARIAPVYSTLRARMHIEAGRFRALADQARINSRPAPTASPKGK